ncbi:hypothetical protein GQ44DRAFT_758685 [Phaeosphaeriaceae sp. PMI808]|nr:hypothetical protein GQ44DRAFT_758685 [Phaeosphaeriaceae sp. PMI808]
MGQKLSLKPTETLLELCEMFKSPYINEEWLIKSLLRVYPGFEDIVAATAPILFKIILHHGTYPFKPLLDATLAPLQTAIAVALLTANDKSISVREWINPHVLNMRHRNWNDRDRLLFQSLCDTDWSQASNTDCREEEDDEDLVAVLESTLTDQSYNIITLFYHVANTLPSSHSQKLDGSVSLTKTRALLTLVIVVSTGNQQGELNNMKAAIESTVLALLSCFPDQDGRINWEGFQQTIADRMPLLLTELAILISNLIPIEQRAEFCIYPTTYSWGVPPAIRGTEDQSKKSFLTMPQLSQLGLVIRRHELDTLHLLRKDEPKSLSGSDITKLFNNSPHGHTLLLVRGRIKNSLFVLACTLPSLTRQLAPVIRRWIERSPLSTVGLNDDCIVQLLPEHRVLRGTSKLTQVSTGAVDSEDLLFNLGGVKVRFAKGLNTGLLELGLERVSFKVELMEVWGRQSVQLGS